MVYAVLADLLLLVHLTFMKFVALGGLMVLRWRWVLWIHLPCAILGAAMAFAGWLWPFAGAEHWLRERAAALGYTGSLVERFLPAWLHPANMPRMLELVVGILVMLLNVYIYRRVFRQRKAAAAE